MKRIQIDVKDEKFNEIEEMIKITNLENKKDFFQYCIGFFKWAISEILNGKKIGTLDDKGNFCEFSNPAFLSLKTINK